MIRGNASWKFSRQMQVSYEFGIQILDPSDRPPCFRFGAKLEFLSNISKPEALTLKKFA